MAWLVALIFFFPVAWMVLTAFKSENNAQSAVPNLRLDGGLDAFRETAKSIPGTLTFQKALTTSLIVVILSTIFVLALAIPAAYALAITPVRKWRDVLFFFVSTKFLPVAAVILPLYTIFQHVHLIDKKPGLIIVYISINLPLAIWMLRSFFAEFPRELLEAAQLDGANAWQRFRAVTVPAIRPAIIVVLTTISIAALKVFDIVRTMTGGNFETSTLANEMYTQFTNFEAGRSAAFAVILFILILPIVIYNARQIAKQREIR
jgi:polyol transport system permease protein